jgi:hypothetical protein
VCRSLVAEYEVNQQLSFMLCPGFILCVSTHCGVVQVAFLGSTNVDDVEKA